MHKAIKDYAVSILRCSLYSGRKQNKHFVSILLIEAPIVPHKIEPDVEFLSLLFRNFGIFFVSVDTGNPIQFSGVPLSSIIAFLLHRCSLNVWSMYESYCDEWGLCITEILCLPHFLDVDSLSTQVPHIPVHFQLIFFVWPSFRIKFFRTGNGQMHSIEIWFLRQEFEGDGDWIAGDWPPGLSSSSLVSSLLKMFPAAWAYCTAEPLRKQLHAMKNLNCNNRLLHANIGSSENHFLAA